MIKKTQSVFLFLMMLVLLLSSCAPSVAAPEATAAPVVEDTAVPTVEPTAAPTEEPQSTEITITDALDREVTFPETPSRIVYAGKSSLMIADALYLFPGINERIVAVSDTNQNFGNFIEAIDPTFDQKTVLSGETSIEEVVANDPDAVLLKSFLAEDYQQPLEELGVPTVFLNLETPEQYNRDILAMGDMLGQAERAQEIVSYYDSAVAEITDTIAGLSDEEKPSVLVLYYKESDGAYTYNVPPAEWMQTTNVITAGGNPVWLENATPKGWNMIGFEQIAAWDADQVYVISYREKASDLVDTLLADPQWQSLTAVKNNQVYAFPGEFYSWDQPDTRWILGLKWLAWRIHPELFPTFDTVAEVRSFFKDMYMLDDSVIDSAIIPLLRGDYAD
jgi:iron complex transport system substrate-binding protein